MRGQVPGAFGLNKQGVEGCLLHDQIKGIVREGQLGHVHLHERELGIFGLHVCHTDWAYVDVHDVGVAGLVKLHR